MSFDIVIPARYASTRLPGKALLPIADKPMVAWVWERAMQAGARHVVIATDDSRIADEMTARGAQVAMPGGIMLRVPIAWPKWLSS